MDLSGAPAESPPRTDAASDAVVRLGVEVSALSERVQELERELGEARGREAELRRQHEERAASGRASEALVRILGHDLRNPLSVITTAASLLARRACDDEASAKPALRILNNGRRMARMIEQLLDLTRIRSGGGLPMTPVPADLGVICRRVLDEIGEPGRVQFELRGDAGGRWDADRLAQLVSHLALNALGHGEVGAPIALLVDGQSPGSVRLEVHNRGVVPSEARASLFDPLARPQQRRNEGSGTMLGLGLFFSEQIVRGHGGQITVDSSLAEGTRVRVTLPRQTPGPPS